MQRFINKNCTTWPDQPSCTKDDLCSFFRIDNTGFDRLVRLGAILLDDGSSVEVPGTLLIQSIFADAKRVDSFVNPQADALLERVAKAKAEYESFRVAQPLDNPGDVPPDVSADVKPDHVIVIPPAPPLPDVIPPLSVPLPSPAVPSEPEQPAKPQNSPPEVLKASEGDIIPPEKVETPKATSEAPDASEAIQPDAIASETTTEAPAADAIASETTTEAPAADAIAKPKGKKGSK